MRRSWQLLVPALVAAGLVATALPALAGEMDHDPANNRLQVRMSLRCNRNGTVQLSWHSIWPRHAASMTAKWYDSTVDGDLQFPTPSDEAGQKRSVHRQGSRASGDLRIPAGLNKHRIVLFVDALDSTDNQTFGLGRNADTIHC